MFFHVPGAMGLFLVFCLVGFRFDGYFKFSVIESAGLAHAVGLSEFATVGAGAKFLYFQL